MAGHVLRRALLAAETSAGAHASALRPHAALESLKLRTSRAGSPFVAPRGAHSRSSPTFLSRTDPVARMPMQMAGTQVEEVARLKPDLTGAAGGPTA